MSPVVIIPLFTRRRETFEFKLKSQLYCRVCHRQGNETEATSIDIHVYPKASQLIFMYVIARCLNPNSSLSTGFRSMDRPIRPNLALQIGAWHPDFDCNGLLYV